MNTKYIEYVIVVHGIGDQRPNETILPVINRFAEVRQHQRMSKNREVVSLGMVSGQSGKPEKINGTIDFSHCQAWSEFKNIPKFDSSQIDFFLGEPSYDGENIRFVDMNWSDIMEGEFNEVGQTTELWTNTLLDRLEMKQIRDNKASKKDAEEKVENSKRGEELRWVLPILYQLEETLVFLKSVLSIKTKKISDIIFDKFLGDVQLYGEYLPIRGKAVRRFHELMNKIEHEHIDRHCKDHSEEDKYRNGDEYVKPRYTILSHSLGTVMSMDTILYGHINKSIYQKENLGRYDNLPFAAYAMEYDEHNATNAHLAARHDSYQAVLNAKGDYIGEKWIDNIANFVTLGSPIDKFLVIWWQNYEYLNYTDLFKTRENKIKHFNYSDEQDPVGHLLNYFAENPLYGKLFKSEEDIVFNRYAVPGKAHVDYWTDYELFYRIVKCTIDNKPVVSFPITEKDKKQSELLDKNGLLLHEDLSDKFMFQDFANKAGVYHKVMWYCYGVLPILMTLFCSFFIIFGWESQGSTASTMAAGGLIISIFLFRRLIKIAIWWRQILKGKNESLSGEYILASHSKKFRRFCNNILLGLITFCLLFIPSYFALLLTVNEFDWQHHLLDYGSILGLGVVGGFLYNTFLHKPRQKYKIEFGLSVDNITVGSILLLILAIAGLTAIEHFYPAWNFLQPLFMKIDFISTDYAEALEDLPSISDRIKHLTTQDQNFEQLLDYQREIEEDAQGGYTIFNVLTLLGFTATCVWMFTLNCLENATREVRKVMKNEV